MHNYLEELNQNQQEAVQNVEGASLIIAGAGSGKTRVLTYKIAYLLDLGYKPYNVLALTFTNKAAKEMKERIVKLVGTAASDIWMGTFHSMFLRILRKEHSAIKYPLNFTIYDNVDSKSVIRDIIKTLKLDDKVYVVNEVLSRISKAKNNCITHVMYNNDSEIQKNDYRASKPEMGRIYEVYQRRCYNANAMDFDDILLNTNILFRDNPEILTKYQRKFTHLFIDEYQDTNFSQYSIIKNLAAIYQNISVVGDDAQSIYSFRGARIENIFNFQKDYPNYKIYKLEQNYRSTKNIVKAANSLIDKNEVQIKKTIYTENEDGEKIKILEAIDDLAEGKIVVNEIIEKYLSKYINYSDFAVLYRTNAQSRIIEENLRQRNIPYRIYGGISFYQRKEIKDVIAYFRLVVNNNDDEALKRIINYPKRGIGDTTLDKIYEYSQANNISIWKALVALKQNPLDLSTRSVNGIMAFVKMIMEFKDKMEFMNAHDLGKDIIVGTQIINELYNDKTSEGISRYENVQELVNGLERFAKNEEIPEADKTLANYLHEISLLTNEDNEKDGKSEKVNLMTVHASKGLEFKNVIIVGMEDGLFPSSMSSSSQKEIEEERRLFYVAITRAQKYLTICYSNLRFKWGQMSESKPSRFLKDIDSEYVFNPSPSKIWSKKQEFEEANFEDFYPKTFSQKTEKILPKNEPQKNFVLTKMPNLSSSNQIKKESDSPNEDSTKVSIVEINGMKKGTIVEHDRFGEGIVVDIEGVMPNTKATINFKVVGQKQLLLKYAKLKILK